jgi:hypothetical protein
MPLITDLLGTTKVLSLRLAASGDEVWALSQGAGKLILYRIDVAAKTIVASTDVGARGTEGVIEGELGGRAILRTWSVFDAAKPSLWLTDGTDADTRWIRNAKDPTAAVRDGRLAVLHVERRRVSRRRHQRRLGRHVPGEREQLQREDLSARGSGLPAVLQRTQE